MKPPGYWEAYFRDLQRQAEAEMLNVDPDLRHRVEAWLKVAEGWRELADYHREEGT